MKLRFEDHPSPTPFPPRSVEPFLLDGERVVTVETVKDAYGYATARVWIARAEADTA